MKSFQVLATICAVLSVASAADSSSLKSESTALTFKGTSKDWRANYLPKLESHLDGRNLAGLAKLGVGEMLMVQTDGSKQEGPGHFRSMAATRKSTVLILSIRTLPYGLR